MYRHETIGRDAELCQLLLDGQAERCEHAEEGLGDGLFVIYGANLQSMVFVYFAVGDALRNNLIVDHLEHCERHPLSPLIKRSRHTLLDGN